MPTTYRVIGLMSGTSLDGLDMAYCELTHEQGQWSYRIQEAETVSYNTYWQDTLARITEVSGEDLILADQQLGQWMGEAVRGFIDQHQLQPDFIASHGHTVFHQPERRMTYQIGSGFALHAACSLPVVSNFRNYDVVIGGQGAPLVPIGDRLLLSEYDYCLNLGGVANISTELAGRRIAYDIGTANMVLNYFARQQGLAYDEGGKLAASGTADAQWLKQLNALDYYRAPFPKSLGYEWIYRHIIAPLGQSDLSMQDVLATATHHAAQQIGRNVKMLEEKKGKRQPVQVLVTGGGAFNDYFMQCVRQYTEGDVSYVIPDEKLVSFKEALVFALLGVLRVRNEVNCLQSVTGAAQDHSAGVIYGCINKGDE